jgi:molecular chaperone GrpE
MTNDRKPNDGAQPDANPGIGPEIPSNTAANPLDSEQTQQAKTGEFPRPPEFQRTTAQHHDDLIAQLRRDVAEYKDKFLRAHAEMENLRRRTEREKEDTAKYANTRFARDLLTVGDNFQRALAAVPEGAADVDPALKSLIEGVGITEREFASVLERHGVTRIDADGEPFDPHLHQAVMEMPRPDVPAGTVVQVFQAGYTIADRSLRPAMVAVSTGGPKPGKSADAAPVSPVAPDDPSSTL